MAFLSPVTLENAAVRLEPLQPDHVPALAQACADGDLAAIWYANVPAPAAMEAWVAKALAGQQAGVALPFAVYSKSHGRMVGSTRFYAADAGDRHVSIGYTWYAASAQRSAVNTASKMLLLQHAFETLGCIRVTWCTHRFNQASRRAIERLGAVQEGVLRQHHVLRDGTYRDTVVYSIIDAEWPAVKRHLAARLSRKMPS